MTALPELLDEADKWLSESKAHSQRGDYHAASIAIERAYRIAPMAPRVWFAAAMLRIKQQDYAWAYETLQLCHEAIPNSAEVCYNAGICANAMGEYHVAKRWYQRATRRKYGAPAWQALASVYSLLGEKSAAKDAYQRCIESEGDSADARFSQSIVHLLRGDYLKGFELYESRHEIGLAQQFKPHREVDLPKWDGIAPGRVLLISEQGTGDTVMMERYFAHVPDYILCCQPELVTWLRSRGHKAVATADFPANPAPPCDYWLPMLSLPRIFGVVPPSQPTWEKPWRFEREPGAPEGWPLHETITYRPRAKRVGICWSGNPAHANDRDRSCPSHLFAAILDAAPDVNWVNLKHGGSFLDATDVLGHALPVYRPESWLATAQLMETLDAVVTVDTACAHMAGTLGIPTICFPPTANEWRWGLDSDSTPFYPSMQLVRRKHTNDWPAAIREASRRLKEML